MKILITVDPFIDYKLRDTIGSIKIPDQLVSKLRELGHYVDVVGYSESPDDFKNFFSIKKSRVYLKKQFNLVRELLVNNEYDVINIHNSTMSVCTYLPELAELVDPKKIHFTVHTDTNTNAISYRYKSELLQLSGLINFVFVSNYSKKMFINHLGITDRSNFYVIYNGLSIDKVTPVEVGLDNYGVIIGRIDESKNILISLDAIKNSKYRCVLIGSKWRSVGDEYYDKVIQVIDDLKSQNRLIWYEFLPHDQLLSVIRNSQFSLCIPTVASSSLTTIEASYYRVPTVTWSISHGVVDLKSVIDPKLVNVIEYDKLRGRVYKNKVKVLSEYIDSLEINKSEIRDSKLDISSMVNNYLKVYGSNYVSNL